MFYIKDQLDSKWAIVCRAPSKDIYIEGIGSKEANMMIHESFTKELLPIDLYDADNNDVNFVQVNGEDI